MPRVRKPPLSAFPTDDAASSATHLATQQIATQQTRLETQLVTQSAPQHAPGALRTSKDPLRFFRVMAEIERQRGLRIHPESPTRH